MRDISVAIVQFHPRLAEPHANIERMCQIIDTIAGVQRVNLIVFPELATTGYECGVKFTELAEPIPGPTIEALGERAERYQTHIAFGMAAKHKVESVVYDAAVLIGPEAQVLGQYVKVHLKPEERPIFRGGMRLPVFETTFGRVGLMIGWDLAFPEAARTLALEGAELIALCANWEAQAMEEWRTLVSARAYENQIFVAAANRIGDEYTYAFGGESMIAGPRGETLGAVGRDENDKPKEAYSIAKVDLDLVKKYREELQTMQSRQPIAYRTVVKNY